MRARACPISRHLQTRNGPSERSDLHATAKRRSVMFRIRWSAVVGLSGRFVLVR